MITPECCKKGENGDNHGHHYDKFKTDAKVVEVVCLNECFQP